MIPPTIRRLLAAWIVQILVALGLLIGLLIVARSFGDDLIQPGEAFTRWQRVAPVILWGIALLGGRPILAFALSKLRVLSVILAEMRELPETACNQPAPNLAASLFASGVVVIALVLLLGCLIVSAPWPATAAFLVLHVLSSWFSWRGLKSFYVLVLSGPA